MIQSDDHEQESNAQRQVKITERRAMFQVLLIFSPIIGGLHGFLAFVVGIEYFHLSIKTSTSPACTIAVITTLSLTWFLWNRLSLPVPPPR